MLVVKHSMQKHEGMMRVIHYIELGFAHPRELGGRGGGGWVRESGVPYSFRLP